MTMVAVGKTRGRMIIGSGKGKNPGTIAGGRYVKPPNPQSDTFGRRVMAAVPAPNLRGGLIDKQQQKDPASTAQFDHPFDGGAYRGVSTQPLKKPTTLVNNLPVANPWKTVDKIPTTDRGTFFRKKESTPLIKTQFGANKSGPKADTAFHPNPAKRLPPAQGTAEVATEKVQRTEKPASFATTGNHWVDPHNSFVAGHTTLVNNQSPGRGRWNTVKRSAV